MLEEKSLLDTRITGKKAATLRRRWQITHAQVAYRAGCLRSTVVRWEAQTNQNDLPPETTEALRGALRHLICERAMRIAVLLAKPDDRRVKGLRLTPPGRPRFNGNNVHEHRTLVWIEEPADRSADA